MALLDVYQGSVTVGGQDGTVVSQNTGVSPITVTLNATINQTEVLTIALRTQTGYKTVGDTVVSATGNSFDKWALSLDGNTWGAFGASLTISSVITDVNTLVYVKVKSVDTELPVNDSTVKIEVQTKIGAV